jgi:GAF domain/ANTAR domain
MGRIERLLALIQDTGNDGTLSVPARLCMASSAAVGVDAAGVSLISADHHSTVATSHDLADAAEDLQASLRQGPCFDAVLQGRAILAPNLADHQVMDRWPAFARSALDVGIHAVFGFPLSIDGHAIGALDLYSRTPRELDGGSINDALVLADLTAIAIHDGLDRGRIAEVGLSSSLDEPWAHRAAVHHATGMTAVHLGVSVDEALLRLRAYAFAASRTLDDVARDVVARRMRLEHWTTDGD